MDSRELSRAPLELFAANLPQVDAGVAEFMEREVYAVDRSMGHVGAHHWSPLRRMRGELPACGGTWVDIVKKAGNFLPEFTMKTMRLLTDTRTGERSWHNYLDALDDQGKNIIFCYMNASVIEPTNRLLQPGERTRRLEQRAIESGRPDLYTVIGQYGIVYGYPDDVEKHLGLQFD